MEIAKQLKFAAVCAAALFFPLLAESGRELGLTYNFLEASQANDEMSVRMLVRVANGGESDFVNSVVQILSTEKSDRRDGSSRKLTARFPALTIRAGGAATASGFVTVSRAEFERWNNGEPPVFVLAATDNNGKTQRLELTGPRALDLKEEE